jgi:uncharacterized membrane protein
VTAEHPRQDSTSPPELAGVVERNIEALLRRRRAEQEGRTRDQQLAEAISRFTGSMRFVYIHLVVFGLWILANSGLTPIPPFDPSFVILAMVASVEAIFLSTFVLITQNRMSALADKRADLDLQISLLAEHEITRVITMLAEVSERLGIQVKQDPELAELAQDVVPERVLDSLEASEASARTREEPDR